MQQYDQPDIFGPAPDLARPYSAPGFTAAWRHGTRHVLVAGSMTAIRGRLGLPAPWAAADAAAPYHVPLGPDRMMIVATPGADLSALALTPGWDETRRLGIAEVSDGFSLIELEGPLVDEVVAHASAQRLDRMAQYPDGSAVTQFARLPASLYRFAPTGTVRLHLDRSLVAHLWHWFARLVPAIAAARHPDRAA